MVIPLNKKVVIEEQTVKLTSLDGRTWVSRAKDFRGFKKKLRQEFVGCKKQFLAYVAARPDPVNDAENFACIWPITNDRSPIDT